MGASPSKHSSDEEAHIEWEHLETLHKGFSLGIKSRKPYVGETANFKLKPQQASFIKSAEEPYVKLVTRKGLLSLSTEQSLVICQKEEYNDD